MTDLRKPVRRRTIVTAECIGCHSRRDIFAGEIPTGGQPMCSQCGMPMIAVKSRVLAERNAKRKKS